MSVAIPETIYEPQTERLFERGAAALIKILERSNRSPLPVALPGGRSVVGLLRAWLKLADSLPNQMWQRLRFFMVDERVVPLSHADSNYRLLNEEFYQPLLATGRIDGAQVFPFECDTGSLAPQLAAYGAELRRCGGSFGLTVLGAGEDGHIAALFPNHHSFADAREGFISISDSPKPPSHRMTSSRALIAKSDATMVLFTGAAKRNAYMRFCDGAVNEQECPAKLALAAQEAVILTDLKGG